MYVAPSLASTSLNLPPPARPAPAASMPQCWMRWSRRARRTSYVFRSCHCPLARSAAQTTPWNRLGPAMRGARMRIIGASTSGFDALNLMTTWTFTTGGGAPSGRRDGGGRPYRSWNGALFALAGRGTCGLLLLLLAAGLAAPAAAGCGACGDCGCGDVCRSCCGGGGVVGLGSGVASSSRKYSTTFQTHSDSAAPSSAATESSCCVDGSTAPSSANSIGTNVWPTTPAACARRWSSSGPASAVDASGDSGAVDGLPSGAFGSTESLGIADGFFGSEKPSARDWLTRLWNSRRALMSCRIDWKEPPPRPAAAPGILGGSAGLNRGCDSAIVLGVVLSHACRNTAFVCSARVKGHAENGQSRRKRLRT
mmetsp:Transcript_18926/g.58755  ORF Transcript_18926/g.58755 Transcript_18926/m.58755 type:complete len:367 (-) Transcript_18926:267-1367(-)